MNPQSRAPVVARLRNNRERGGRWLKLVSGIVMVALGGALLVRPAWLAGPLGHG